MFLSPVCLIVLLVDAPLSLKVEIHTCLLHGGRSWLPLGLLWLKVLMKELLSPEGGRDSLQRIFSFTDAQAVAFMVRSCRLQG